MQITISLKNGVLVKKNLEDLHAEIPRIAEKRIEDVLKRVVRQVQNYPPQRSGSTYTRTNTLKGSPKIVPSSMGRTLKIDPVIDGRHYATYVIGDFRGQGQAWMHVGNWLLVRDIVDFEMTKLPNIVEQNIKELASIKGFG